jgi:hypothetical protein
MVLAKLASLVATSRRSPGRSVMGITLFERVADGDGKLDDN